MKFHPPNHSFFDGLFEQPTEKLPDVEVYLHQPGSSAFRGESIFVDEKLEPNEVIAQFKDENLQHLVQKNQDRFEQNLLSAAKLIENPEVYFESEFCFFEQDKIETLLVPFRSAADKEKLKQTSMKFVGAINSISVNDSAGIIIEELYMNAIKDAPAEAQRKGWAVSANPCELYLCRTKEWLQISCMDYCGSLEIRKILDRMHEVYDRGAGSSINMDESRGAGLGCVLLFENSVCLILGVQPGRRTKVSCFVPLQVNNRQRTQMKKSLHWFEV